jgi:hypothetical protein
MSSVSALNNIIDNYVVLRSKIKNNHNGHSKLGCVAFSPKLNHQRVLCVWV